MKKRCVLDDNKFCDDCGECNRCDLDPDKICDNCMKCVRGNADFAAISIDKIYSSETIPEGDNP